MTRADIKLIREELECIRGWIQHWDTDRFCKLVPTQSSLEYGKNSVERAMALLDHAEAMQRGAGMHDKTMAMVKAVVGID
ncbi:hypothetical protein [Mesorhizobium caraganae]|uniref:hypothetical protein n=1 Tax=Mesorhizobium caraganae TaxID=483206 RepID=UPI00177B3706|nr:hypothetical protein [Mesorhizobium caraganae]